MGASALIAGGASLPREDFRRLLPEFAYRKTSSGYTVRPTFAPRGARTPPARLLSLGLRSDPVFADRRRVDGFFHGGLSHESHADPARAVEEESRTMQHRLGMSTAEIGLTVHTTNCLEERGIFTVQDCSIARTTIC